MNSVLVRKYNCAVCNLRTDVPICRECANDAGSLARVQGWITKLGSDPAAEVERARLNRALELLRTL